jgi:hypothetical protein
MPDMHSIQTYHVERTLHLDQMMLSINWKDKKNVQDQDRQWLDDQDNLLLLIFVVIVILVQTGLAIIVDLEYKDTSTWRHIPHHV